MTYSETEGSGDLGWVEAKVGHGYTSVGGGLVHGDLRGKEKEAGSEEE